MSHSTDAILNIWCQVYCNLLTCQLRSKAVDELSGPALAIIDVVLPGMGKEIVGESEDVLF